LRHQHLCAAPGIAIGLFDENIRYGYEDLELGFRLFRAGFRSHLNRRCLVFHYKKPQSAEEYLAGISRYARELGRGAAYYYWKHRCLSVMMSTGIFPFAVYIHKRFFSGGQLAAFMRRALTDTRWPAKLRILPGLILYRLEFYDAVCRRLDELGE
jgi:GT2 family glycosyltransferase